MTAAALSAYKFAASYGRYLPHARRRETPAEAFDRVVEMHRTHYASYDIEAELTEALAAMNDNLVLGSQRGLQFGGSPILRRNARLYNCTASYCDRPRFFQEMLWLLLCGTGVGFSVQRHHVAKLPKLIAPDTKQVKTFIIPDTIEGWSDALGVLLASYGVVDSSMTTFASESAPGDDSDVVFTPEGFFKDYRGSFVGFDFSRIREKGADLSTGAGKAPGPGPLMASLEHVRGVLDAVIKRTPDGGSARLRPIDCYDIVMHASDAVLSGGVRRSATICLFSPDDDEMLGAKTGNWMKDNPQRARSNNSAMLLRDCTGWEEFHALFMQARRQFGEPGFVWADNTEIMYNPCQPANAPVITPGGIRRFADISVGTKIWSESGWVEVVKKWSTGVKPVFRYRTSSGWFLGTDQHRIVQDGEKVEVGNAEAIDVLRGPSTPKRCEDPLKVLAGFALGGGSWHRAGGGLLLNVGAHDQEILEFEGVASEGYGGSTRLFKVTAPLGLLADDLCPLPDRRIPDRILRLPSAELAAVLRGLYSANGSVVRDRVTLKTSSRGMRDDVQLALSSLGIKSYFTTNRAHDVEFSNGTYTCKESYDVNITTDVDRFAVAIGFVQAEKQRLADILGKNRIETQVARPIIEVEEVGLEEVFDITVDNPSHTYWTGGCNVSNCVEIGLFPSIDSSSMTDVLGVPTGKVQDLAGGRKLVDILLEDGSTHAAISDAEGKFSGWAFCVSGDTLIMTPSGVFRIEDCVGAETQIWNGKKWSKTTPFQTTDTAKLYRVELSDGSYLDCDANHRWLVKDRFGDAYEEVATTDLMTFSKYPIHTPRSEFSDWSGITEPQAYELGFILGDGSVDTDHGCGRVRATLYGKKIDLPLEGRRGPRGRRNGYGVDSVDITFDVDVALAEQLKRHPSALRDLHSWDAASILDFFAGWADADGSQAGRGIRIYSTEERCRWAQLLLSRVGILCSVNLHHEGSTNFGERTEASWYIQITECQEIGCHRLDTSRGHKPLAKGRYQIIRSVTELEGTHATFCLEEPETGCCVFNNVLTKQCNLCEINAKACDSTEKWRRAARAAAILGTLQAGYTSFGYLGPVSEAIARREALLGVSMTGMMDNPVAAFDPELQRELAALILDVNESMAAKIGIQPTARATCVKPAGSTSCILGTSSGIHAQHAKRYFRRAQANEAEAPLQFFAQQNPAAVEKSVWNPNGSDAVITFCIEAGDEALTRNEVSGLKQLEYVKLTQENWVEAGRVEERCARPWLRHNVSNTITVAPHEEEKACRYIYDNREAFAGISILSESGDLDYPQAPFCEVRTEEELLQRYGRGVFFASGLIVDGLHAFGADLWQACATVLGQGESEVLANGVPYPGQPQRLPDEIRLAYERVHEAKKDWVRRARQFAQRYFNFDTKAEELILAELSATGRTTPKSTDLPEDVERVSTLLQRLEAIRKPLKRMTHCLKEVNNLKLWADLTREWVDVDYTAMVEDTDGTVSVLAEQACGGQGCLLTLA